MTLDTNVSRVAEIAQAQIDELKRTDLVQRRSIFVALQNARRTHQRAVNAYTSAALTGRGDSLDRALANLDAASAALQQARLDFDKVWVQ